MKKLLLSLFAAVGLIVAAANVAFAQNPRRPDPDLAPGMSIVKMQPDTANGETRRWEIHDKNGDLSSIWLDYKDGRHKNEHYGPKRVLSLVYETDYKTFSRLSKYNPAGVLVTEETDDGNARPIVTYVNAEAPPDEVILQLRQTVRFFSSKNNLHVAVGSSTSDGGTTDVLKWTVKGANPPSGYKDAGGYKPVRQGAANVSLAAKGNKTAKLTVLVKDTGAKSGAWGRVIRSPLAGNPPNIPGKRFVNSAPVPGAIVIATDAATGKEVARTRADSTGSYTLALPAGKYEITPEYPTGTTPPARDQAIPRPVEVKQDEWKESGLLFSTGIH